MKNKSVLLGIVVVIIVVLIILWRGGNSNPQEINEGSGDTALESTREISGEAPQITAPQTNTSNSNPTGTSPKTGQVNTNPGNVTPALPRLQVNYTDDGFLPISVVVQKGQTVRFMNQGKLNMWLSTNGAYPQFDQVSPVSRGEYYDFTFSRTGSFTYINKSDPGKTGTIIVK